MRPPDLERAAAPAKAEAGERVSLASNDHQGTRAVRHIVGGAHVAVPCPLKCPTDCDLRCPASLTALVAVVEALR